MTSRIPGIQALTLEQRMTTLKQLKRITDEDVKDLLNPLPIDEAAQLSENVIGRIALPLGVATNFIIDGVDRLVPMATEEASVVAAASHAAKLARDHGGFTCSGGEPVLIGQVHLVDVRPERAVPQIEGARAELMRVARDAAPGMVQRGGGPFAIETRALTLPGAEPCVAVHILVNTIDAMGANTVNTVAEAVAPALEELTGGRALLRILSNHAPHRLVEARATFDADALGAGVAQEILRANRVAQADPFRAVTHLKGVMNGIVAVALATGNDTRAVEAAAHAWMWHQGLSVPTDYRVTPEGHLAGKLRLPIPVGIVGGHTKANPAARAALRILGVKSSRELARVACAAGLASNAAALRALVHEGIQHGHMRLHARSLVLQAGVTPDRVEEAARRLVESGDVSASGAARVAASLRAA